jgi:outer membrane lipoprotein-sorting protein
MKTNDALKYYLYHNQLNRIILNPMKRPLASLVILLFTVQIFQAQTADNIIAKYFESVGGIEKWKNLKSIKMTGKMVILQGEFPITLYRKSPNKFKIVMNIEGQEIIPQAFDGETGWMNTPFGGAAGPQKMEEDQVRELRDVSEFEDPLIDYKARGFVASYEGTADTFGVQCYIVKLIRHKGIEGKELASLYYFDTEHYLPVMIKQPSPQAMGQEIEIHMSEYQETSDGVLMPFVMDTHFKGQSVQKLNFTAITINEELADDLFKFPETKAGIN